MTLTMNAPLKESLVGTVKQTTYQSFGHFRCKSTAPTQSCEESETADETVSNCRICLDLRPARSHSCKSRTTPFLQDPMLAYLLIFYIVVIVALFFEHKARVEAGEPGVPFLGRQFNRFLPQNDIDVELLSAPLSREDIEQSMFPDLQRRRSRIK
uniref:Transmembrane protein n=1 Tax=Steinernema glaseri TaxID=37863 RepID=A0A1I7YLS1_9BILA